MSYVKHDPENIRIGQNIKALRVAATLDRHQLAGLIGRSYVVTGHIERGRNGTSPAARAAIASALKVPIAALTDDDTCNRYVALLEAGERCPACGAPQPKARAA